MDKKIIEFLVEAKKNTYAAKGAEVKSSRVNSHDLKYEKDNLMYYDTYLGTDKFSGTEAVYLNNKAIWSLNYMGRVLDKTTFSGDFLKEALMKVTVDNPYRGPVMYNNGDYEYKMILEGEFDFFKGYEVITYKNRIIYECNFIGGALEG